MAVDLAERPHQAIESERTDFMVKINRRDLPWIAEEALSIPLAKIRSQNGGFLFGSAIRGKALVDAASGLDEHRSTVTNNLLHTHLPQFAEGFNPHVKIAENTRTLQPIFYVGNKSGQRVYFMRFGKIEGMPVIIRIAACDKAKQLDVLGVITTKSKRELKSGGKIA